MTKLKLKENLMKCLFAACAVFSVVALAVITVFLLANGTPFVAKYGLGKFLFGTTWHPMGEPPEYGIFPMIVGSLYVTGLSVAIGITLGLFVAISLYKFIPKRFVAPVRHMINLLAGIPSVIYGMVGLNFIVPFLRDYVSPNGVGYGILAASLVLSVMILPTVVSVSLDSLQAVPQEYYQGALALGATKEQATFTVMLPAAKSGIVAGVVLAIGRAIGETMAVVMVIGNSPEVPTGLFQSMCTLTANIAQGALELPDEGVSALIASGVVLFVFTFLLNASLSLLKKERA